MNDLVSPRLSGATLTVATLIFCSISVSAYEFDRVQDIDTNRWRQCDAEDFYGIKAPNLQVVFDRSKSMLDPSGQNGGPYTKTTQVSSQGTRDAGLVSVPATDPDNPTNRPAITLSNKVSIPSYIWVVNTGPWEDTNGTVSKFNTETNTEEGRYRAGYSPSRTAVDLDSNAWVGARGDGLLTKVIALTESCPDVNGNGMIDTSSGTNVLAAGADECIVYQDRPFTYVDGDGNTRGVPIRGLAADALGNMWIGYSTHDGHLQPIDVATLQPGQIVWGGDLNTWAQNGLGVHVPNGGKKRMCGAYGLVVDKEGRMSVSNTCRNNLPVYNTVTGAWVANYLMPGNRGFYGITTDSKSRVWMGSWPDRTGVRMFDQLTKRLYEFPATEGTTIGLSARPDSPVTEIWASFPSHSRIGYLTVDEVNVTNSSWNFIQHNQNMWGGVGFDANGFAWNVGNNNQRGSKFDPVTKTLVSKHQIGHKNHYTYSDFTGSTAQAFTAPSGRWRDVLPVGVPGQVVRTIDVEGFVPSQTSVGVRFRALDRNGNPTTDWFPKEIAGSPQFYPYVVGQNETVFPVPQGNDNPFFAEQIEVDLKLATSITGKRPFINTVDFTADSSEPAIVAAQGLVNALSIGSSRNGTCSDVDARGCDDLRIGLSSFSDGYTDVVRAGEDTATEVTSGVATTTADGLTNLNTVVNIIASMPELKSNDRDNFALIVTDGRINRIDTVVQSVQTLCAARARANGPLETFTMSLGTTSNLTINSLISAAGGTGQCCAGNQATCKGQTPLNICDPNVLRAYLTTTGSSPFTEVQSSNMTCEGTFTADQQTRFKTVMYTRAQQRASSYAVKINNDPLMYNDPTYPQRGLLADPDATRVKMEHITLGTLRIPYCPPPATNCGLFDEITGGSLVVPRNKEALALSLINEGWYFEDPAVRSVVKLTPRLANEITARNVQNISIQAACQCFKPEGQPCDVPGYDGQTSRCTIGTYSCRQSFDACVPTFRPMPEICDGLDNDCNGIEDDFVDRTKPKPKAGVIGRGLTWEEANERSHKESGRSAEEVLGDRKELTCGFQNICRCDLTTERVHVGKGDSFADELSSYFKESFEADRDCLCAEGLTQEDVAILTNDNFEDGPVQTQEDSQGSAGCSSAQNGTSTSLLLLAVFGLFFGHRRKRRRD